ncbi:homoserine dehydrogenase [uncultured Veillonella sp.]|uniref:homoserine dehydrogenase n=1 Tax=uncultured Veillonella sp. TaxID=159268 RepID=UPI0026280CB6|nr:homoserine dehydrogenase [uncultured Veillonella sp.]
MEQVNIALLGFGTVGRGTYELLVKNQELIANRSGVAIKVKRIFVRNVEKHKDYQLNEGTSFTTNFDDILTDESIHIVVEVMGGTDFAAQCVEQALMAGKNVATANKDLLADRGPYLLDLAAKNKVDLRYEASVLGGVPIIRTLYESLGGNKITEIIGILNGTTNFILSNMTEKGAGYEEVLKEAQALGFAEADPTSDVEGYDAARKLAILSSIAFNRKLFFDDVTVEGITRIDATDIAFGKEFGYTIKLLGIAKETKKGLSLNVHPAFIDNQHPLASVRGSYNALYVKGNGIDDAMFYGRGAGSLPTGSSVVSDIMEIAKNVVAHKTGQLISYYYADKNLYAPGKIESSYYIRLLVDNNTGVLAKVASKLAEQRISVQSVIQRNESEQAATLAIVTSVCPQAYIMNVINAFKNLRVVREVGSVIRIMAE